MTEQAGHEKRLCLIFIAVQGGVPVAENNKETTAVYCTVRLLSNDTAHPYTVHA